MDPKHDPETASTPSSSSEASEAPMIGVALVRITIRDTAGLGKAERPTLVQIRDSIGESLGDEFDFEFGVKAEWVSE